MFSHVAAWALASSSSFCSISSELPPPLLPFLPNILRHVPPLDPPGPASDSDEPSFTFVLVLKSKELDEALSNVLYRLAAVTTPCQSPLSMSLSNSAERSASAADPMLRPLLLAMPTLGRLPIKLWESASDMIAAASPTASLPIA